MVRPGRPNRRKFEGVHDSMILNELKNILSADRYILLVGGKEYQYRNCEMYKIWGNHQVTNVYSFPSKDNVIEIKLVTAK